MIPRILHQTWKSADVPDAWAALARGWRERHPGWEYRLWTDADLRRLVEVHAPTLLPVFDGYRHDICRVDLARYLVLQRHGGVYVDLDFECLRPLDPLLEDREIVLGLEPKAHLAIPHVRRRGLDRIVSNAFMASERAHPFWAHVLREAIAGADEPDPLEATGPFLLSDAVDAWPEPERITLLPAEQLQPLTKDEMRGGALEEPGRRAALARTAFAVHHWAGSWVDAFRADARSRPPVPHESDFLFFRHLEGRHGLFLDVGAHRGQSARSLRMVNRSLEIVSFEPNPEHGPALASVGRRLGEGFRYHRFGLGSRRERRRLVVPRTDGGDLSPRASLDPSEYLKPHVVEALRRESRGAGGAFRLEEIEVEIRRLDDLELAPAVLKLDVEGWEARVLAGGERTLRRHTPIVLVELNNHPPVDRLLRLWGYAPFRYLPEPDALRPWRDEWDALNLFYLHADSVAALHRERPRLFAARR